MEAECSRRCLLTEDLRPGEDAPQPYLDADFGKELSYQLWITKGARFIASRRLAQKYRWSGYSLAALSLYVIVLNLMLAYEVRLSSALQAQPVAFASTVMAVLILLFAQLESSKEYNVRSREFHDCAMEIGRLYREIRHLRTGSEPANYDETVDDLSQRYAAILDRYRNHEAVDYDWFRVKKKSYFTLGKMKILGTYLLYYVQTFAPYQVAIFLPPILLGIMLWLLRSTA